MSSQEKEVLKPKGKFLREKCELTIPAEIERPESYEEETFKFCAYIGDEKDPENGLYMFQYIFTDAAYMRIKEGYSFYYRRNKQWEPAEGSSALVKAIQALAAENTPEIFYTYSGKDEKNNLYFTLIDRTAMISSESLTCTVLSQEGNRTELVLPVSGLDGWNEEGNQITLSLVQDEHYYVQMQSQETTQFICFDSALKPLFQIPAPGSGSPTFIAYIPDRIVILDNSHNTSTLFFMDAKTGKLVSQMDVTNAENNFSGSLVSDSEGTLYFSNHLGIASLKYGSDTWEQILEKSITPVDNERSTIHFINSSTFMISSYLYDYLYYFDPNSEITSELSLFALPDTKKGYYKSTLEFAAIKYMDQNPEVSIHIEIPEIGGQATVSDFIKALNTRLLAGEGEDILMLDNLPYQALIEKDLLLDLSDVLQKVPLFPEGMTKPFEKDSAVYAIPAKNQLPFIQGRSGDLENITDLSSMVEACRRLKEKNPDAMPFFLMDAASLAEKFYNVSAPAWITEEKEFNALLFSEFLTNIKELSSLGNEEYLALAKQNNWTWNQQAFFDNAVVKEHNPLFYMTDLDDLLYFVPVYEYLDYTKTKDNPNTSSAYLQRPGQIENAYFPSRLMSINKNTKNAEEAKNFIQFVLTDEEVQGGELFDGLPVLESSLEKQLMKQTEISGGMSVDGVLVRFDFITESIIDAILDQYSKLTTPVVIDNTLHDIVMKEAEAYFSGNTSLDTTVQNVKQRAELYLNE